MSACKSAGGRSCRYLERQQPRAGQCLEKSDPDVTTNLMVLGGTQARWLATRVAGPWDEGKAKGGWGM
jgi:hypothetical protein